ncbi:MAG: J domain-containing protein [Chloroflexota bacterium]
MAAADHYAALGIARSASAEEIRAAYRRAARASHPDLHPGDASAQERFKRVQQAYEVLGNAGRRAVYDAPPPATPPSQHRRRPVRRPPPDEPVSLARELGETVRAIRVVARRSGFGRRMSRLIQYLERL